MKKILIFTAGYGEGHNAAANGISAAVRLVAAEGEAAAQVHDLFKECYGPGNECARRTYIGMINHTPRLWEWVYGLLDDTPLLESTLGSLFLLQARLAKLLEREKPDAVVSVYPVYNYLIRRIFAGRKRPFAQVTVVTDSISVNSVWHRGGSDYFIVPNEDTAAVMRDAGVDEGKIKAFGFPVTPRFATEAIAKPAPAPGEHRVLYMINSGKFEAPNIVKHLLELPGIRLTVTFGRDAGLRAAVEKVIAASGRTVEVYGWTDQLPRLLMENHLLISKAGGATVQEAIAAKTPMLIMQVVPGQEAGNARLLLGHRCGALTETPTAIVQTVAEAFDDGAKVWREWEKNIAPLSKPDAALVIARFLLGLEARG